MRLPQFLTDASGARSGAAIRALWIGSAIIVALAVLVAGLAAWTASPSTCASCHEIAPSVNSWKTSPHAQVGCPACHEPVRPWWRFPESLAWRAQMYQRDVAAHSANPEASSLPTSAATLRPIPDENCLRCHDLSREVTLPKGLIMDHAKHVECNKSCVSCHRSTGHPPADVEKQLVLMEQCFTCHGDAPDSKAPGTCTLCHPVTFSARPQSHTPQRTWLDKHGKAAKENQQPCAMCHEKSFCDACHGLTMPHPASWAKGDPPAHSVFAKKNTKVCVQCHGPAPNLCSMCHHRGDFDPAKGPWVSNHAATVNERGTVFCLSCHHDGLSCYECHRKRGVTPTATPTP
jgi:hypothetical protein